MFKLLYLRKTFISATLNQVNLVADAYEAFPQSYQYDVDKYRKHYSVFYL